MKYFSTLLLYRFVLFLLSPLLVLALVIRSFNHKAYRQRLIERLGIVPKAFKENGVIVHAASVGEVIALKSFIEQLLNEFPDTPITVTTFTPTGSAQVTKQFGNQVQHCYLPLDIFIFTWLFLKKLKPKAMIFMETELWPNIIAQASAKESTLLLVNARLSDSSMKSYKKIKTLITPTLNKFDQILCQSHENHHNFLTLGANDEKCSVSGNLKFDISLTHDIVEKLNNLSSNIESTRPIWLVASTHQGEEEICIAAFKKILMDDPHVLLLLVPRHPERFAEVLSLCQQSNLSTVTRSSQDKVLNSTNVWLIDTLGELMAAYGLANVITVAGSFSSIGGHNPLEPALHKKAITVGYNMSNFNEVMDQLIAAEGIVQITNTGNIVDKLADSINTLLNNRSKCIELGEQAYSVVQSNQGASKKSINALKELINI